MSDLINRKFICTGCGKARPCYLETNQEKGEIAFFDATEYLKCVLDETNQTAPNWKELEANEADTSDESEKVCDNWYCKDGVVMEQYGEKVYCDVCNGTGKLG